MAQRLTQQREIYVKEESTEGVDPGSWTGTLPALLVSNLTITPDRQFLPRTFTGTFGSRTGRLSIQPNPTISFSCELRGGNTLRTPEIDLLLKSVFGAFQDDGATGRTVAASPAPTNTVFTASADASVFTVGNAIAVETAVADKYEIGWIAGKVGSEITLTHALTFTPASGADLKPSVTYKLAASEHPSLAFRVWLDSANCIMFLGCKGTVKIDAPAPGAISTATFTFQAMSWQHVAAAKPTPSYVASVPPTTGKFKIDATLTDVKLVSWDLAQQVARKMSQNSTTGTFAQLIANRDLKGALQAYDIDESQFTGWNAGTEFAIAHQLGDTQFNLIGYQLPKAQRSKVGYGDDNGLTTDAIDFQGNITNGNDEAKLAFM